MKRETIKAAAKRHADEWLAMYEGHLRAGAQPLTAPDERHRQKMRAFIVGELRKQGFGSIQLWMFGLWVLGQIIQAAIRAWLESRKSPVRRTWGKA